MRDVRKYIQRYNKDSLKAFNESFPHIATAKLDVKQKEKKLTGGCILLVGHFDRQYSQ
jgi:hypothetical protein